MSEISAASSIACQIVLLVLSLGVILTRAYVRILLEGSCLKVPDYLTAVGWLLTLGWVVCTALSFQLGALDAGNSDGSSVPLLKVFFVSNYFFDLGLFFPKFSIIAFYWSLIPNIFHSLRRTLYLVTAYACLACVSAFCLDTFWCYPVSNNWDPEYEADSTWNSWVLFRTNYAFNLSADVIVFVLPFFILPHLKLQPRQRKSLIGIFSLGLITIIISISRFTWENFNLDVPSGDVWCTAELSVALIVVSLPSLKILLRERDSSLRSGTSENETATLRPPRPRVLEVGRSERAEINLEAQIRDNYYKRV